MVARSDQGEDSKWTSCRRGLEYIIIGILSYAPAHMPKSGGPVLEREGAWNSEMQSDVMELSLPPSLLRFRPRILLFMAAANLQRDEKCKPHVRFPLLFYFISPLSGEGRILVRDTKTFFDESAKSPDS